jgi:hypothetical protein
VERKVVTMSHKYHSPSATPCSADGVTTWVAVLAACDHRKRCKELSSVIENGGQYPVASPGF